MGAPLNFALGVTVPRVAPNPNSGYPPRWEVFDRFVTIAPLPALGFSGSPADVNRFAARYRASSSFIRAEFVNLGLATSRGYSELCNLLLAYSAFEYYLKAVGLTIGNSDSLISVRDRAKILAQLHGLSGSASYFRLIRARCSKTIQHQIDLFLMPRICNPFCLAAAGRHAFAHGALTPNPTGLEGTVVEVVTRFLRKIVMRCMELDFEKRMMDFEDGLCRDDA